MKYKIRVRFTMFTFWGTVAELEAYAEYLIQESFRYAGRGDFASVLAIDKELLAANKMWIHQQNLQAARERSLERNSFTNALNK